MSKRNHIIGITGALLLSTLAIGTYLGSAPAAAYTLKQAGLQGDTSKLDRMVDFPRVRESLRVQYTAAMIRNVENDPKMINNPFSGLAVVMGQRIIEQTLETNITAAGISKTMKGNEMDASRKVETRFLGLDKYEVTVGDLVQNDNAVVLLFERRGLWDWVVVDVEQPNFEFEVQL